MRELLFILAFVFLLVWDVTQNHGALIRAVSSAFLQLLRQIGLA